MCIWPFKPVKTGRTLCFWQSPSPTTGEATPVNLALPQHWLRVIRPRIGPAASPLQRTWPAEHVRKSSLPTPKKPCVSTICGPFDLRAPRAGSYITPLCAYSFASVFRWRPARQRNALPEKSALAGQAQGLVQAAMAHCFLAVTQNIPRCDHQRRLQCLSSSAFGQMFSCCEESA